MIRGFEVVDKEFLAIPDIETRLPLHGSKQSAGYDFYSKEKVVFTPGKKHKFMTDIKAFMLDDEFLQMQVRSSIGVKKGLRSTNQVGIIDSDYYNNPKNDGNICVELQNTTDKTIYIDIGDRIAQGIFQKWLQADEGTYQEAEDYTRSGGIGHTGK